MSFVYRAHHLLVAKHLALLVACIHKTGQKVFELLTTSELLPALMYSIACIVIEHFDMIFDRHFPWHQMFLKLLNDGTYRVDKAFNRVHLTDIK